MAKANTKGSSYEREVCKWIFDNIGEKVDRELGQARDEGADIKTEHFLIEAKRRETLNLNSWWNQVLRAKSKDENKDLIPVVVFRRNRKKQKWLIPASLIGVKRGYMIVNDDVFLQLALALKND